MFSEKGDSLGFRPNNASNSSKINKDPYSVNLETGFEPKATFAGDSRVNHALNLHANSAHYYPDEKFVNTAEIQNQNLIEDKPFTSKGNLKLLHTLNEQEKEFGNSKYNNTNQSGQNTFGMFQNSNMKNQNDMYMMPENFMDTRMGNDTMGLNKRTRPPTGRSMSRDKNSGLQEKSQQNLGIPLNNERPYQNTYHHNLPYNNQFQDPNSQRNQNPGQYCMMNTNAYSNSNQHQIMNYLNNVNDYQNYANENPEKTYFSNESQPNFNFGMTNNNLMHNYDAPEYQATLRKNIDKLGGLQTTVSQMKGSLLQNELRNIELNNQRMEMTNQPMPKSFSELNTKAAPIMFNKTDQHFSSNNQFNYENHNDANLYKPQNFSGMNPNLQNPAVDRFNTGYGAQSDMNLRSNKYSNHLN